MTTITDTFTRANSTTTLGSTESPAVAWTANQGTWGINTNRAYSVTQTDGDAATVSVGQADMAVSAKLISPGANRLPGVVARFVNTSNFYMAEILADTGNMRLSRVVGGSETVITSVAFADGDVVTLSTVEESGSTRVILSKNNVQQYTTLDSTVGRPAGTRAGLRWGVSGTPGPSYFDDFSVVATVPPVDTNPSFNTRVEVAFTTDPDDPAPAFRDLTSRRDLSAGIDIQRGRDDEFSQVQPGSCSLTLDNYDGALTMGKTSSPYYPNVVPGKRLRVTYRDPTATGGNLLSANAASIETSSADWDTTSAFGYIAGTTKIRSSTHALDGTWALHVTWPTTGVGNTAIEYTPVVCVIGRQYTLSLSVYVPTGGHAVRADVLLTAVSSASTVFDAFQRLTVTWTATQQTHYVGVSVVGSTAGQDVWVDSIMVDEGTTAGTFTTNPPPIEYRFDGHVEEWPLEWPNGGAYAQAQVSAHDMTSRVGIKRRPLRSVIAETVFGSGPLAAYYPMGEPEESTTAGDVSGNTNNVLSIVTVGAGGGTLTFGTGTGPGTDAQPAPQFAPTSVTNGHRLGMAGLVAGGYADLTLRVCALTSTNVVQSIAQLYNNYGFYLDLRYDATGHLVASYWDPWAGVFKFTITSANSYTDGQTHNPALTLSQSGGVVTAKLWDGGTQLGSTATFSVPALPNFDQLWVGGGRRDQLFTGTLSHVAVFNTACTSTQLGDMATAALTGFAGERSDQRIARIAAWAGIPTARLVLDVGNTTSMSFFDSTGKSPLQAMQDVADTEAGVLFADTQGRLVFHNRARSYSIPTVTASVDANLLGRDTEFTGNLFGVINDAKGSRPAGGEQTYSDAASVAVNGYQSVDRNIQVTSDLDVAAAIQWLVNTNKTPRPRLSGSSLDAFTDPSAAPSLRALDVDSRLDVTGLPSQGAASSLMLRVNGYHEHIGVGVWAIDPSTSSYSAARVLVYDDPVYGKYDSGNVYGY